MSDNGENHEDEPAVKAENTHISLKIAGTGFPELLIKVKRTTKLSKMMTAYCERAGKNPAEVRFMFDGTKILPHSTVVDLDIEEDEDEIQIEVCAEAIGGAAN